MSLWQREKGPIAIVGWWGTYEIAQSKRAKRLSWVAIPNSFDEPWFKRLSRHPQNMECHGAILLAYELMVRVASRMPVRGILANETGPLSPLDLFDMTGYEAGLFSMSYEILMSEEIGRLKYADRELIAVYTATQNEIVVKADAANRRSEQKALDSEEKAIDSEQKAIDSEEARTAIREIPIQTDRQTNERGRGRKRPLFSSDFARAKKACEEKADRIRSRYDLDNHHSRDLYPEPYAAWKKLKKQINDLNEQIIGCVS